ncbi:MAG: Ig-like domain-containing protein [Fibrobacteria bacterium]|nr:Ig-like domain-containing protein [Fibrobacteria bacterium]
MRFFVSIFFPIFLLVLVACDNPLTSSSSGVSKTQFNMNNPGIISEETDSIEVTFSFNDKRLIFFQGTRDDAGFEGPYVMVVEGHTNEAVIFTIEEFRDGVSITKNIYRYIHNGKKLLGDTIITVRPDNLELKVNSADTLLAAKLYPIDSSKQILWSSTDTLVVRVSALGMVSPVAEGSALIIAMSNADSTIRDTVFVVVKPYIESFSLSQDSLRLIVGGKTDTLKWVVLPQGYVPNLKWTSSDSGIAFVDQQGIVTAQKAGTVTIIASEQVNRFFKDSCRVTSVLDIPTINPGAAVEIIPGMSVPFSILVTQEYGILELLKWDLDGDSLWDDSVVSFSEHLIYTHSLVHTYNKEGQYVCRFETRDGEGNVATATRTVNVVAPGSVTITAPTKDTLVNETPFQVSYTLDGIGYMKMFDLSDGENILVIDTNVNPGVKVPVSVKVVLDTTKPLLPVFSSIYSTAHYTQNRFPAWFWSSIDSGIFTYTLKDTDSIVLDSGTTTSTSYTHGGALADGSYTLSVNECDIAGNCSGIARYTITVDTVAPATPVFTSPGGKTNSLTPSWTWKEGNNENSGGKGGYDITLKSSTAVITRDTALFGEFIPFQNLTPDGSYTLIIKKSDLASNWSDTVSQTYIIDTQIPNKPNVIGTTPTNNVRPAWTWSSGGSSDATGQYQFKFEDGSYSPDTAATTYTHTEDLANGFYTLYVRERDDVGNWSLPDSFIVEVNTAVPSSPSFVNASTSERYTQDNTPVWTWKSEGGVGTFKFRLTRNDTDLHTSGETAVLTYTASVLADGDYVLFVSEKNNAGTWSGETASYVTVDTKAPVVAITSPATGVRINTTQVNVVWTIDSETQLTETTETLSNEGANTIVRSSTDEAGNTGVDSVEIIRDTQDPNAPTISGTTPTKNDPLWSWTSGIGGNGSYQYRIGSTGDWTATQETSYTTTMTSGTYILYVQEQDSAGNWSPSGSHSIIVDKVAPTINLSVTSPHAHEAGDPFVNPPATIEDSLDSSPEYVVTGTIDVRSTSGSQYLTYKATDHAGNVKEGILTVNVRDTKSPVIMVNLTSVTITQFDSYDVMSGITADDSFDGALSANVVASPPVLNTDTPGGPHTITYTLADAAGNNAVTKYRSVTINPKTYGLTITNDGRGTTTPSGTQSVNHGAATAISTTDNDTATFVYWIIADGIASIADSTSPSTTVTLSNGNATVEAVFWTCGDVLVDSRALSAESYGTVRIGDQCWMSENLAYLPQVDTVTDGTEKSSGKYYYVYGYEPAGATESLQISNAKATSNFQTYGVLYNWDAAMDGASSSSANPSGVQGSCPDNWHLPSDAEWTVLDTYVGGLTIAGKMLKTNTWGGTNDYGFSVLSAGVRYNQFGDPGDASFGWQGNTSNLWTSTEETTRSWNREFDTSMDNVSRYSGNKWNGYSVRCVQDAE